MATYQEKTFQEMKKPFLSIIIPVYKVEKYLDKCVCSVLRQTFTDFEVILVDDGSPDKCPEMCDNYARQDSRVRVLHKENGGLSSARNAGLDVAIGEYIGFIDSDDYIDECMYETLMKEVLGCNADIALCGVAKVRNGIINPIKTVDTRREMSGIEATKEVLLDERMFSFAVDKVYRASLWDGIRYPQGVYFEDTQTTYKLFERCRHVVQIPDVLYYYLMNDTSICHNSNSEMMLKRINDNFTAFLSRYLHVRDRAQYADIRMVCAQKAFLFGTDALLYDLGLNNSKRTDILRNDFSQIKIKDLPYNLYISYLLIVFCFPLYKQRLKKKWKLINIKG